MFKSILKKTDDILISIIFFAWIIIIPIYVFLNSQPNHNQTILQIGYIAFFYVFLSSLSIFFSNPKIEMLAKLIFLISYAFFFYQNVNLSELFAPATILALGFLVLFILTSLHALIQFTRTFTQVFEPE